MITSSILTKRELATRMPLTLVYQRAMRNRDDPRLKAEYREYLSSLSTEEITRQEVGFDGYMTRELIDRASVSNKELEDILEASESNFQLEDSLYYIIMQILIKRLEQGKDVTSTLAIINKYDIETGYGTELIESTAQNHWPYAVMDWAIGHEDKLKMLTTSFATSTPEGTEYSVDYLLSRGYSPKVIFETFKDNHQTVKTAINTLIRAGANLDWGWSWSRYAREVSNNQV